MISTKTRGWRRSAARIALACAATVGCALIALAVTLRGPVVLRAPRIETSEPDRARLERIVRALAVDCAPRSYPDPENLRKAGALIESEMVAAGDAPLRQCWNVHEGTFCNVLVRRPGTDPSLPMLVVGAHYDGFAKTPGADDDASGIAALLELERVTAGAPHRRTLLLAAFSCEEPPFFHGDDMGSAKLAQQLKKDGEHVELMVALDMVGTFCGDCQTYPMPWLVALYPSRGNYLAVTGDFGSSRAIRDTKRGLLAAHAIPVVSFRAPRSAGFVDLSDHLSFWNAGYPAALVTDTAMLRNPGYHGVEDVPDELDYERMGDAVRAMQALVKLHGAG